MSIYINSSSCISAQESFSGNCETAIEYTGTEVHCIEPEYNTLLDPKITRRMSRVIKMGMATAFDAIKKANSPAIDAIITGTGLGCLDDTGNFLSKLSDNNNRMMNPTAFIQSTHNTVGSQVALHLGNKGYNCTYSHLEISFENALQDAFLLLKNNEASNILVGAYDELTPHLSTLLGRLAYTRKEPLLNTRLYDTLNSGTIAGEGCAYFVMSKDKSDLSKVQITDLQILYKPQTNLLKQIFSPIIENSEKAILITGKNGNIAYDSHYKELNNIVPKVRSINYKHLCGSFPTSTSFALWLAVEILSGKKAPLAVDNANQIEQVCIYHCNNHYHTIIRIENVKK